MHKALQENKIQFESGNAKYMPMHKSAKAFINNSVANVYFVYSIVFYMNA